MKISSFFAALIIGSSPVAHGAGIHPTSYASVNGSTNLTSTWASWSPCDEIAPHFSIEKRGGRHGEAGLKIEPDDASQFGAWRRRFEDVHGGRNYRFTASYRARNVAQE